VDPLSEKLLKEIEEMQQRTGRMLRNVSLARMMSMHDGSWLPPVDVYESVDEYYVYADLAGIDHESLSVTVDDRQVRIRGKRQLPCHQAIASVHQVEIELGQFSRTIHLPGVVDVDAVSSKYTDGILTITLPKKQKQGRINVSVSPGEK
jgi:HSP20 family protein